MTSFVSALLSSSSRWRRCRLPASLGQAQDLAPYIADARRLQLVLLGGRTGAEVEGHDWEYLLSVFGWLHLDQTLGLAAHRIGLIVMVGALVWAAIYLTRARLDVSPPPS